MNCRVPPQPTSPRSKATKCTPGKTPASTTPATKGQPIPQGLFDPGRKGSLFPELIAKYNDWVFAYVLTTVDVTKGKFVQHGSAPNFQGGLITLCTCMHHH